MKENIDISIVICTRNRCESLKKMFDSLLIQDLDTMCRHEIIVVDNNSADQTKKAVEYYSLKFNGVMRYVFESNRGLSYARNKGIQESKGNIIVFIDDDCIVDRKWIQTIYTSTEEIDFDVLGGRILPKYPINTPSWIKDNADLICGPVLCYDYGESTKKHAPPMMPIFGANMIFKREVFDKHGLFRTDLGAGQGAMGEDTELYNRIAKHSNKIFYCGNVVVWHPVATERMTLGYIARWNIAYGKYCVVKDNGIIDGSIICYWGIPRYLFRKILICAIKSVIFCFNRRKFLVHWVSLFREIGAVKAYRKYYLSQAKGI